ncbi:MAG: hypothetical protein RIB60_04200 [Phycisphaerales bacterium]
MAILGSRAWRPPLHAGVACLLATLLMFVGPARAQDVDPNQPGLGEVQIDILQLGVGGQFRPGSWAGIQVRLNDLGLEQRNVVLRVRATDPDGDQPLYDNVITTNPGVPQAFWVYLWVPYDIARAEEITVRAHEAIDAGADSIMRAGRILGSVTEPVIVGRGTISPEDSVIGVVNQDRLGLDAYRTTIPSVTWPPTAHDLLWVTTDVRVSMLPDRWQGLEVLDALVWGRGADRTDPGLLTPEQATAIERWVERGGHLIVVLPSTGQEWIGQASNRLRRLLPEMRVPIRHEGVDLAAYRPLFTDSMSVPMPGSAVVHELVPQDGAAPGDATPILESPEGWCIAMRRTIGSGAVTVIGVDLMTTAFRAGRMPEPARFWHRILGRRGEVLTQEQLDDTPTANAIQRREARVFDDDLDGAIAKSGRAAAGLLFGVVLFIAYWVIAGPAGYLTLAKRKQKHLAWVVFVLTTGVFTVIAWTGAAVLRPKQVSGTHVTYFEQVHGQDVQRARSWVSLLVPSYGDAEIRIGDGGSGDLVAPWTAPGLSIGPAQNFPDNRGYQVSARDPYAITVPTRQTVKQVRVDWAGDNGWSIRPMAREIGGDAQIVLRPRENRSGVFADGTLVHNLPGELEEVRVIIVGAQRDIRGGARTTQLEANAMVSQVWSASPPGVWPPDQPLDLAAVTVAAEFGDAFLKDDLLKGRARSAGVTGGTDLVDRLTAVRFFSQFPPADLGSRQDRDKVVARRVASHGWDLGRWFTQPCVIVVGHLVTPESAASAEASPVPLRVNERDVPMHGRTVITWVYPLAGDPPEWTVPSVVPAEDGG